MRFPKRGNQNNVVLFTSDGNKQPTVRRRRERDQQEDEGGEEKQECEGTCDFRRETDTYLTFRSRCHTVSWMRLAKSLSFSSKMKRWSKYGLLESR